MSPLAKLLMTIPAGVCLAGLVLWMVGLPIHRFAEEWDRRNGVEAASRGCGGALLAVCIAIVSGVAGAILIWRHL